MRKLGIDRSTCKINARKDQAPKVPGQYMVSMNSQAQQQ